MWPPSSGPSYGCGKGPSKRAALNLQLLINPHKAPPPTGASNGSSVISRHPEKCSIHRQWRMGFSCQPLVINILLFPYSIVTFAAQVFKSHGNIKHIFRGRPVCLGDAGTGIQGRACDKGKQAGTQWQPTAATCLTMGYKRTNSTARSAGEAAEELPGLPPEQQTQWRCLAGPW